MICSKVPETVKQRIVIEFFILVQQNIKKKPVFFFSVFYLCFQIQGYSKHKHHSPSSPNFHHPRTAENMFDFKLEIDGDV